MDTKSTSQSRENPQRDGFYLVTLASGPTEYLAVFRDGVFRAVRVLEKGIDEELALNVTGWRYVTGSHVSQSNGGLTDAEQAACLHIVTFWNLYLKLPLSNNADDLRVIRDAVHAIQGVMAVRVARRVDPDFWR